MGNKDYIPSPNLKLIMMIGLMGSGKTTETKKLIAKYDAVTLSSDVLREEFPGKNNNDIFEILYDRAKTLLNNGISVILDATNLTIKTRMKALEHFKKIEAERIAYVVATPYEECVRRLYNRETGAAREGILNALKKYSLSFQAPVFGEGWNTITIQRTGIDPAFESKIPQLIADMIGYDQQTHWHDDTLEVHAKKVRDAVPEEIKMAAWLHDIGKMETQSIDAEGQAHYYGHANIGAYQLLLDKDIDYNTVLLVNYHMLPFSWETPKTHEKYRNIFGQTLYYNIMLLHEADINSHKK